MTTKIKDQHLILVVCKLCVFLLLLSCKKDTSNTPKFVYDTESNCRAIESWEDNVIVNDTLTVHQISASTWQKVTFRNPKDSTSLLFPTPAENTSILKIDTTVFVLDGYSVFKVNDLKYLSTLEYEDMTAPTEKEEEFNTAYKVVRDNLQYLDFQDLDLKDDGYPIGSSRPVGMFEEEGNLHIVTCNAHSMMTNTNFIVLVNEISNGKIVKSYKVLETRLRRYSTSSRMIGEYLNVQIEDDINLSTCISLVFKQDSVIISNNSSIEIYYPPVAASPKK